MTGLTGVILEPMVTESPQPPNTVTADAMMPAQQPCPGGTMRIRTTVVTIAALTCALTACSSSASTDKAASKPSKSSTTKAPAKELTEKQKDDALASAGIPKEPTGADRAALLRALAAANPDVVKYEDKAIDAARNQCSAINGGGSNLDYFASQRFSYKDVTTTEAQGKQINAALKGLGFCKV